MYQSWGKTLLQPSTAMTRKMLNVLTTKSHKGYSQSRTKDLSNSIFVLLRVLSWFKSLWLKGTAESRSAFRLLPSAFCLLLSAFRFLLSAFCFLPSAFCFLPSAFCLLLPSRNDGKKSLWIKETAESRT